DRPGASTALNAGDPGRARPRLLRRRQHAGHRRLESECEHEQRTARGSLPWAVLYMEPAGIEPASANGSFSASTCVFRSSSSHPVVGARTASSGPAPLILIRARRRGTHGPARFVVASGPTSGRVDPETGA